MKGNKKILIISYFFPPYSGISSRRWAKFAKYLSKENAVTVIAARNESDKFSPWDEDVKNIEIIYLDAAYPDILNKIPKGFFEKIKYRLAINKLKKNVSGTIFDRAALWQNILLPVAEKHIEKERPDIMICNGPPHRVLFYGTLLKKKFPWIKLITDFRDPWTWWYNFDYSKLTGKDKSNEEFMESEVMKIADQITVTTSEFKEFLDKKYPDQSSKICIVPHAFDSDEVQASRMVHEYKSENIRFVYFGTLYLELESAYTDLNRIFLQRKDWSFDVYSEHPKYDSILKSSNIRYLGMLDSKSLFGKLSDYDYFLYYVTDSIKNNFSTKIYELINARIPIIIIGPEGDLSNFISKNRLGIHLTFDKMNESQLLKSLEVLDYDFSFDVSANSFTEVTKGLEKLF